MHLTFSGFLALQDHLGARIQESSLIGQDELWSADNMYRHLTMLEEHVSRVCQFPFASSPAFNCPS